MLGINLRGTYLCSRAAVPHLKKAANPHILTLSPPLNLNPAWFSHHVAYTIAKYGMSLCVLGMAEEFRADRIAVNALWPRTLIATAALQILPGANPRAGRKPEIMADAAHVVLTRDSGSFTGRFLIDEDVLGASGVSDFGPYAVDPGQKLMRDLFLDEPS
jgi:citronellol/citronellal dehydrogenase